MADYSSNMTLGEKWDMRQKLRMAKTFRTTIPYEEKHLTVHGI
jgi:hypothetical protein